MRTLCEWAQGLLWALAIVAGFLFLLSLVGCASGVRMTDEETIACREHGCSVWTEAELIELADKAARAGYRKGWTDANRQAGRDL